MPWQFTHPEWLLALPLAWGWVIWWTVHSDVQIGAWRRWLALGLRLTGAALVVLAMAGRSSKGRNLLLLRVKTTSHFRSVLIFCASFLAILRTTSRSCTPFRYPGAP